MAGERRLLKFWPSNARAGQTTRAPASPEYLATARLRLRPGAYDAGDLHVRAYITPRIGDVPLQALNATRIKSLYAELRQSGRARGGARCQPRPCTTSTGHCPGHSATPLPTG